MADELVVITHIDLIPKRAPDGTPLLEDSVVVLEEYANEVVKDPGVLRFELLQQVYRKNHFEMLTVFSRSGFSLREAPGERGVPKLS